jgi:tetratricopeptide (TPR) repeat protein
MSSGRRRLSCQAVVLGSLGLATMLFVPKAARAGAGAAEPELRARLHSHSRHELVVLGLEGGDLRLRPADSLTGEIRVLLADARDLQFLLGDTYSRAHQLAFHGRSAEALPLLEPIALRLVPFLEAPGTNAIPVVTRYFDLLLALERWTDALGLADRLPMVVYARYFAPNVLQLARGLRAAGRPAEAVRLITRMPLDSAPELQTWCDEFADELRRYGHFAEAQVLYARESATETETQRVSRLLRLAYVEYHQAHRPRVVQLLGQLDEPSPDSADYPLHLLLRARMALEVDSVDEALDLLGRAVVQAGGTSEWCAELLTVIAAAYRASGRHETADTIDSDLRKLHPGSRGTAFDAGPCSPLP